MTELVRIARVVSPQGLKGELKLRLADERSPHFREDLPIYLEGEGVWRKVKSFRQAGNFAYLLLEGIDSIDQAETLRGETLFISEDELEELPPDHYYIRDLLGYQAVDGQGRILGELTDIYQYPANDVFEILTPGGETVLLPAVKAVISRIEPDQRILVIKQTEGFFNED